MASCPEEIVKGCHLFTAGKHFTHIAENSELKLFVLEQP
jgi:hypothetical protein